MPRLLQIDPAAPDEIALGLAAAQLAAGRLVAFPTETVYGLGAHALDAAAVARIFAAKSRPATNPLIVHVADEFAARQLAEEWPPAAHLLAARFWPGPLSIVVRRRALVPDIVTAGGPTVALRVPAHPVALALLRKSGLPIAAPSANRSLEVSPTTAQHVAQSLGEAVDLVLDAGPTTAGIESTVIDLSERPWRVLRPGPITPAQVAECLGETVVVGSIGSTQRSTARSPGMQARHYAPRALVACLSAADAPATIEQAHRAGRSVGVIHRRCEAMVLPADGKFPAVSLPDDAAGFASGLYAALRELDEQGVDVIFVVEPPDGEEWLAVRDRLARASAPPL